MDEIIALWQAELTGMIASVFIGVGGQTARYARAFNIPLFAPYFIALIVILTWPSPEAMPKEPSGFGEIGYRIGSNMNWFFELAAIIGPILTVLVLFEAFLNHRKNY